MDARQRRHHDGEDGAYRRGPDSPVTALPFGPTGGTLQVTANQGILMGFAAIETTGAASATFDIIDGGDANGPSLLPVSLQPGQSTRDTFSSWGVWIQRGLTVKVSAGSVRGILYVILAGPEAGR